MFVTTRGTVTVTVTAAVTVTVDGGSDSHSDSGSDSDSDGGSDSDSDSYLAEAPDLRAQLLFLGLDSLQVGRQSHHHLKRGTRRDGHQRCHRSAITVKAAWCSET